MPGVPRELIEHELHLDPQAKPVKQWLRCFTQDKKDVIKKEIARLLDVGFIKEVYHLDWLDNPVLVPKKNKEWRVCVDYTDLNKSCKKDPFELPWIDQVMDSTAGCSLLSFLNCYLGYHQISLKVEDQIKTSFITPFGAFCYITMPLGLKSVGVSVFFALARYRAVKILCSYFEVVLRTMKNYKAHYYLSWFRPLIWGNSPTSSAFVLEKKNNVTEGVSWELEMFAKCKGVLAVPTPEG
jgi:hypothetical protein